MTSVTFSQLATLCPRIGTRDVPCPACGPHRRAPSNRRRRVCRIWRTANGFISFNCVRCGIRGYAVENGGVTLPQDGRSDPSWYHGPSDHRPKIDVDADQARRVNAALQLWNEAVPIEGTLGERYLVELRRLHIALLDPLDHALRWNGKIGAMVALMTHPIVGSATGVHRTYLAQDGMKLERKMLGKAGVVRLSPDENVTVGLGLAEGVEDAIALLLRGWGPAWAAGSAPAIARFPVLSGIEALTIFPNSDEPGMAAARICAERWREAGKEAQTISLKDLDHD